ncbi:MAG: hypothetical protein IBX36_01530 [Dehalococcoidia bacterium]|nr:hypothetical protein [Dehalococcoidia bacterium]
MKKGKSAIKVSPKEVEKIKRSLEEAKALYEALKKEGVFDNNPNITFGEFWLGFRVDELGSRVDGLGSKMDGVSGKLNYLLGVAAVAIGLLIAVVVAGL